MQYSHSWRNARKPPKIDADFPTPTGISSGYDGRDMLELNRLIELKCKTPRAKLEAAKDADSGSRGRRER